VIARLPENCSALYADLLQKVMDSRFASLSGGSFVAKKIRDAKYWYYQTRQLDGARKQYFLGRDTPEIQEKIATAKAVKADSAPILDERRRLVAMLSLSGATMEKGRPAKIMDSLSQAGLFTAGGTLVGSFAFSCYGNMLGVSFDSGLYRTEDMDFSLARGVSIGIGRNLQKDLLQVDSTLKIPRQINPAIKPFELIASDGFKVEFLTTQDAVAEKAPVLIEHFAVHALPLAYMDYLIEHPQPAVLLNGAGIFVRVPDPARFALHKLAISQLRPSGHKSKADKDLRQAEAILQVLLEDNPGLVLLAANALRERADLMVNLARKGMARLPGEIREALEGWLPEKAWNAETGQVVSR
jgi:hypothetical protein